MPWSLTSDGRLAYHQAAGKTHFDLWTLPVRLGHDARPASPTEPFLRTPAIETWPAFSPDGRWTAYASDESRVFELYVRPFPGPGRSVQVSRGGGRIATWSGNGRELLYQTDDQRVMVVEYAIGGSGFVARPPTLWTAVQLAPTGVLPAFGLAADGERIMALLPSSRPEDRPSPNHVTLIFNFFEWMLRQQRGAPPGVS